MKFAKLFKNNYFEEYLQHKCFLWTPIIQEHLFAEDLVEDLQTAGSEKLVRGSLFNLVASVTAWKHLTVIERDSSKGISLWILWNFLESFFATPSSNHFLQDAFFSFFVDQWGLQPPKSICWSNGKLLEGIHKSLQCCAVTEIRWKLNRQVVTTHVPTSPLEAEEKKELKNLLKWAKFSFYVMIDTAIFTYVKRNS